MSPSCSPSPARLLQHNQEADSLCAVPQLHTFAGETGTTASDYLPLRGKPPDRREENGFLGKAASFTKDILDLVLSIVLAADTPRLSAMIS